MIGYGQNQGIVPITCQDIFKRIEANKDAAKRFEVEVSSVEIYNEKVQDLLVDPKRRPQNGLEIRQNNAFGVHIPNCVKRPVDSYKLIEQTLQEATENRTVGTTRMNATSSRAHTVLTIEFKQFQTSVGSEDKLTLCSKINLVDLAGSEKSKSAGTFGQQLKEGAAINKSLSTLSLIIERLAQKAAGKRGIAVPYRESKLTRLLQNALGGSSKTIMICALSPASTNYQETLSTLRYASNAKKIQNIAVVNENPQEVLVRQLREENAVLKEYVVRMEGTSIADVQQLQEKLQNVQALHLALDEYKQDFGARVTQAKEEMERRLSSSSAREQRQQQSDSPLVRRRNGLVTVETWPHIVNLNEDMLLTGRIKHWLPMGKLLTIGLPPAHEGPDPSEESDNDDSSDELEQLGPNIVLSGHNIFPNHATIKNEGHQCVLHSTGDAAQNTYVGGIKCSLLLKEQRRSSRESDDAGKLKLQVRGDSPGVILKHGNTIAFGHCLFFFVDPSVSSAEMLLLSHQVSYDAACRELSKQRWEMPRKLVKVMNALKGGVKSPSLAALVDDPSDNDVEDLLLIQDEDLQTKDKEIQKLQQELTCARRSLVALELKNVPPLVPVNIDVAGAGGSGEVEVDLSGVVTATFGNLLHLIEKAEKELQH